MDFVTGFLIAANKKVKTYDLILVIVNRLIKIIYYKPVKVIINISSLVQLIINVILRYYYLPNLIVIDQGSVFGVKFFLSLCHFLGKKQKLSTAFY